MSDARAWEIALQPSRTRRRLLALAAAGCCAAALALCWAGAHGARAGAWTAAAACAASGLWAAAQRARAGQVQCLRLLAHEAAGARRWALPRAVCDGAAQRAPALRGVVPREITLLEPRAVHVSTGRIVLRARRGGAVIWRDAVPADDFRRLAAFARWSQGGHCL